MEQKDLDILKLRNKRDGFKEQYYNKKFRKWFLYEKILRWFNYKRN
jgi:hypothetical protein